MADKPIQKSAFIRIVRSFDLNVSKGKGSEIKIHGPVRNTDPRQFRCARVGDHREIPTSVVAMVRRRFQLRERDGITDEDFYGRS